MRKILFLLFVIFFLTTTLSKAAPNTDPLKWAPPTLTNPVTINLGTGKTSTTLDDNTDYVINLPGSIKYGATVIKGGRNVVIKGGEIVIPADPGPYDADRRAIYIANNQGVVHIEGALIRNLHDVDSNQAYVPYDAIAINSPNSVVQIENVRIEDVYGTQAGFHGDIIQPWGGVNELRVYNLTASTGYQGLFLAKEPGVTINGAYLENIDLTYESSFGVDGGYLLYLDKQNQCSGTNGIYSMVMNEVYVVPDIPRLELSDQTAAVGRSIWPDSNTSFGCTPAKAPHATNGPNWYWPDLTQITDGNGSNGVVITGLPSISGNHFVPSGTPGLGIPGIGYESPGYVSENYTEPVAFPEVTTPLTITVDTEVINKVQSASNQNPQGGSLTNALTATMTAPVTSGNTVIVAANNYNNQGGSGNVTGVTDNYGNTYLKATSITGTSAVTNGTRWHGSIWYAKNVTGGPDFAVTIAGNNSYYAVTAVEYSGIGTVNALGPVSTNFQSVSSTSASSGSIDTTTNDNLLFGNFVIVSGSTATAPTGYGEGYSLVKHYNGVVSQTVIEANSDAPGPYSATLTWSSTQPSLGMIASFLSPPDSPAAFNPTLNVTSPTANTTPAVTFSTTDPLDIDYYQVKIDDGSFSTQTSPYTLPTLGEGSHTITVRAYNTGGSYTDGFVSFVVDTTGPVISSIIPTTNSTTSITDTTLSITDSVGLLAGGVSASGGTLSCEQLSSTEVSCTATVTTSGSLSVTVEDLAGNSTNEEIASYVITTATPSPTSTASPLSLTPAGAPICTNTSPTSAPVLYSALAKSPTSVSLLFTQAQDPVDSYVLEYGLSSGKYEYAAGSIGGQRTTSYLVQSLAPNVTYYFRVRGGNGCAVGPWSNEISTKTIPETTNNDLQIVSTEIKPIPSPSPQSSSFPDNQTITQERVKTYSVKVSVVDDKKQPVQGAEVTLHSTPQTVITNSSGIAQFENVEGGEHKVLVSYNGYEGEQGVYLTGDVKEFDINIEIAPENVWQSPQMLGVLTVSGIIILILIVVIIRKIV